MFVSAVSAWMLFAGERTCALAADAEAAPKVDAVPSGASAGAGSADASAGDSSLVALKLVSAVRSTTPEAIKAELIAAEEALSLRAQVDGLPVVYDSPAVSISLRKVSPENLLAQGTEVAAPDGASIKIPADPRIKGRHGGPVTVTVTSYHAGDALKDQQPPKIRYSAERRIHQEDSNSSNATGNTTNSSESSEANSTNSTPEKDDRVDFFMTKTSVSWRGSVDVKVPGLSAQVPAHDRPWTPYGEANDKYLEEKAEVRQELERLASLPVRTHGDERLRGYRRLARKWHPDKHAEEDREKATEVFEYMQELREALGLAARSNEEEERTSS
eukprot:TRINITY_DN78702_c0_g1_i1.p1 TRINITY_DN78702_c0_g1~~TRINITY_DN78702_c0_g1_i1.p1  ORF type:complete len:352 (+),score=65.75 TRINITY_DN78702_c0_g1_i1:67-1056(+)